MTAELLAAWHTLVPEVVAAIEHEWRSRDRLATWIKRGDGTVVSDLDLRLDVAIRTTLAVRLPDVAALSEELGWLDPQRRPARDTVAIIDPVDGTESLVRRQSSWWCSLALVEDGVPVAGLLHQPMTGMTHNSVSPRAPRPPATGLVGVSPDQHQAEGHGSLRARLETLGATVQPIPHAVEKVAAVLEGRCDAAVYTPSTKSPGWHAWDLAACLAVADRSDVIIRGVGGELLPLGDLCAYVATAWVCARDEHSWHLACRAAGPGSQPPEIERRR